MKGCIDCKHHVEKIQELNRELELLKVENVVLKVKIESKDHSNHIMVHKQMFNQMKEEIVKLREAQELLKEVKRLTQMITNSSPETQIKGEIESLALYIGHHPLILEA